MSETGPKKEKDGFDVTAFLYVFVRPRCADRLGGLARANWTLIKKTDDCRDNAKIGKRISTRESWPSSMPSV